MAASWLLYLYPALRRVYGCGRAGAALRALFLAAGIRVPGSSDRPVAEGAPLAGMQSMVERLSSTGVRIGEDELDPSKATWVQLELEIGLGAVAGDGKLASEFGEEGMSWRGS